MSDDGHQPRDAAQEETTLKELNRLRNSFQEARAMMLGVELGLFDHLTGGPATVTEIADVLGLELRGAEITLDALTALGYLTKDHVGGYANTSMAETYLVRSSAKSVAHIVGHSANTLRSWAILDTIVRDGFEAARASRESAAAKPLLTDRTANRDFIIGMAEVSRDRVAPVVAQLPLGSARRFVDLGGGPGHYSWEVVQQHPEIEAVLVDLPLTIEVAEEQIAARGLSDRIDTIVCDFYAAESLDPIGPADVVFISQVLHAESPRANRRLLAKVVPHVRSGGFVVVNENLVDDSRTAPKAAALFAMNMLACTPGGRSYTAREIALWLEEAGLEAQPALFIAERTWLIIARKP